MPDPTSPRATAAPKTPWRHHLHEIIFEADTPAGKLFDVILLITILASIVAVMLESVVEINERYALALDIAEWVFTGLFTIEYVLRLMTVRHPIKYARSFFGVVDLLSILPTFISLLLPGSQALIVIRGLRLLRVFRVLKMARYVGESHVLFDAMRQARPKITVFLVGVLAIVVIVGTLMYLLEGDVDNTPFTSIPISVYWAIVTLTTVGYGDVVPQTVVGKLLASGVMVLGYAIIAVPTGIISAEIAQLSNRGKSTPKSCAGCSAEVVVDGAKYCHACGESLDEKSAAQA